MRVGTIVRVPLHGRRVRGWVLADDVEPETASDRLLPLTKVASAGPPAEIVDLCKWAAWRYAGPVTALLRAASPPNAVAAGADPEVEAAVFPSPVVPDVVREARRLPVGALAWPPANDRRELVLGLLADEGSTIVVVPDAARVSLLARQLEREGRSALEFRGDAPDATRTAAWARARAGACVVVGGRIAVFAPVPDLGAVVVLDDGDESLKEERAPAWHAREVALERAHRDGARITLVSPAPTVEADLAATGGVLRPERKVERAGWPRVEVVDPRDEEPGRALWTSRLVTALQDAVAEGRAVCVLNRRGRARLLACRTCTQLATCGRCGAAVADTEAGFECPRCGETRPRVCLHCHGSAFTPRRPGVSRLRDELAALLGRARVAEVDAATDVVPDAEVLIGTEAVLHRVPAGRAVVLCAFLEFDQELLAARYRAGEQALWLLARAARLVGPRAQNGRVLVQTRVPGHEVLEAAAGADPTPLLDAERARRRTLGFPPFGGLAEVAGAPEAVTVACDALRARAALSVLGPNVTGARASALLQAPSAAALCDELGAVDLGPARATGRLRVDVDPLRV